MDLLMNGLLVAATLFAGGYCWVLARRVQDLKSLDRGLGGSIVTLTRQIELARATLEEARSTSKDTRQDLAQLVVKADAAANQLKLLIAAAPIYPPAQPAPQPAPLRIEPAPVAEEPAPLVAERPVVRQVERQVERTGLRAVSLTEFPEAAPVAPPVAPPVPVAAAPVVMNLAEVPKPKALVPVENPLRRARGGKAPAAAPETSEDAILEALTALAGKGR